MSIDWQAIAKAGGIGKGEPVTKTRRRAKRQDVKSLRAFQDAVWLRESVLSNGGNITPAVARCQQCGDLVVRVSASPRFGHVHHVVSRRHQTSRYDPANGELLCRACHQKRHRREF